MHVVRSTTVNGEDQLQHSVFDLGNVGKHRIPTNRYEI